MKAFVLLSAVYFPKGIDRSMKSYYDIWYDFIL